MIDQTQPQLNPQPGNAVAINLAPAREIAELYEPPVPTGQSLNEFFDGLIKDKQGGFVQMRRELHAAWEYLVHMIEGRPVLRRSHTGIGGHWRLKKQAESTDAPVKHLPRLQFYVNDGLARWRNLDLGVEASPEDDSEEAEYTAKSAQHIHDWIAKRVYTERFKQEEYLNGATTGSYARYSFWDPLQDEQEIKIPVVEEKSVKWFDDAYDCAECGAGGSAEGVAGPQCPQCGSQAVEFMRSPTTTFEVVVDHEKRPAGGVACEQVNFFELLFDFTRPLETSGFLNRDRLVTLAKIKSIFPNLRFNAERPDHSGLQAEQHLAYATPYSVGLAESELRGNWVVFSEWWFDASEYQDFTFATDEVSVGGQVFKAGTKATDYFPKGCYIARVGSQAVILEMRPEHHSTRWVSAPYHLKLVSGLGLGIFPTAEAARQLSLVLAQAFHQMRTAGTPGAIYDKDVLTPEDAKKLSDPSAAVPANTGHLPEGKTLRDAFLQLFPQPLPGQFQWYEQVLNGVLQTGTGAVQFSGALPNVDNRTKGGAEIAQSLANQQDDPQHGLKADADARSGMIFLELFRDHAVDQRWIPGLSKERGLEGAYFSGADLKSKIRLEAIPGSSRGRSDYEQRIAFQQATEALLAHGGVEQAPPDIVAQISDLYGVRFRHLTYNEQHRLVRIRLNQAKRMLPEAIELMQAYPLKRIAPDPTTGQASVQPVDRVMEVAQIMLQAIKPPIEAEEPGQEYAIDYLRRWFLTDEGIEAHDLIRAVVKLMIQMHRQAFVVSGQEEEATVAAAHPMAAAVAQPQASDKQPPGKSSRPGQAQPNQRAA